MDSFCGHCPHGGPPAQAAISLLSHCPKNGGNFRDFRDYAGKEAHLPFDQHFMRALIAPRPVLSTDGERDAWANPVGTQLNYLAAQPVYDFLGVSERNGIHFRPGGHDHNEIDYRALLDFADWQFFGKEPTIRFDKVPFPEKKLNVDWETPR
ncbi:MAG: hypothetical protein H3C30_10365 [Candidatus Hydrogenedentes bacterium]|nr:hypothetical protein [Candidatus Hydrogenedentota bacterium]